MTTTPRYKVVDNQITLVNGSDLSKDDLTAEIRLLTCNVLVAQRKITILNRELKLKRMFEPEK